SDHADARGRVGEAVHVMLVFGAFERDVVAEPFSLLVGVRVAADVYEQGRVVDHDAVTLIEANALGHPQRDQALPQAVLHRLPETKIDAQRQCRDQLGQAHPGAAARPPTHHHLMISVAWPLTRHFRPHTEPVARRRRYAWWTASRDTGE